MKKIKDYTRGFTLVELLIVVVIIGVLASVALPLYNTQARHAQRAAAQSQMLSLAGELERFRAKNFSYRGFVPVAGYDTAFETASGTTANMSYLVPRGSTKANYAYRIMIVDSATRSASLVPLSATSAVGLNWTMIARPNTNNNDFTDSSTPKGVLASASRLVLDSRSVRCMTPESLSARIKDAAINNPPTTTSDAALCGTVPTNW